MDYYSGLKMNEVPACATTWMTLEVITANERSQTQYHTWSGCTYMKCPQEAPIETESRLVFTRGRGGRVDIDGKWAQVSVWIKMPWNRTIMKAEQYHRWIKCV